MKHFTTRGPLLAGLLLFTCNALAQAGFLGIGGSGDENPSLTIATAEIALDVPTPVQANNLELLLAQASQGGSLSELKEGAVRKFSAYLQDALNRRLSEHFADEQVPLVAEKGFLTLRNFADVSIAKQLSDLKNSGDYELERGNLEVSGDFHYRLENLSGAVLREQRVDLGGLRIREKYQVKTPHGGGEAEDTTDAAIEKLLSQLVERLLDRIEDNLEADELRDLAAL